MNTTTMAITLSTTGVFYLLRSDKLNCYFSSVGRYGLDYRLFLPIAIETAANSVMYTHINDEEFVNEMQQFLLAN